ncbi:hypothetical protein VIGAN_11058300 [Vigna angularis var. angularis]|uniref:Uncharacterized protein n=1 Tax=Vigna angularis var. angularis TaxID=157739 RepID=A0A0S3T8T1_PHAAN|nr:hypothetical protein VIGAN_11058300 [Vigna angularis var. angularis]
MGSLHTSRSSTSSQKTCSQPRPLVNQHQQSGIIQQRPTLLLQMGEAAGLAPSSYHVKAHGLVQHEKHPAFQHREATSNGSSRPLLSSTYPAVVFSIPASFVQPHPESTTAGSVWRSGRRGVHVDEADGDHPGQQLKQIPR